MNIKNRDNLSPYTTKDTSEIREFFNPGITKNCKNLSLAEATLPSGCSTQKHMHPKAEEIYYVLSGSGLLTIGEESQQLLAGDAVLIPSGAPHEFLNNSEADLRFLCHCAPGYTHNDTVLLS